jgi:pectinesterase
MKQLILALFTLLTVCISALAQEAGTYKNRQQFRNWTSLSRSFKDAFFTSPEAQRIGDNLLLYQQTTGGWKKNTYFPMELSEADKEKVIAEKSKVEESTIDNNATTTEIIYLSRLYLATKMEKYREGALKGINYLLDAQLDNGGWAQFSHRAYGYYTHITYNDNAMRNVMLVVRDIYEKKAPFGYVPDAVCERARRAFDKGIDCILKTQVVKEGKPTVWCAQHDEKTLAPAKARSYELPSLSGQESDGLVELLMSLPEPTPAVKRAIEGAVEWFRTSEVKGLKRESYVNAEGKRDYRMVPCQDCPPLWGRFYTLDTNRPFFCDRDGVMKFDISEIGHERRTGYSWYNSDGIKVLKDYEQWKKLHP